MIGEQIYRMPLQIKNQNEIEQTTILSFAAC